MRLEGTLDAFSLPDIFQLLSFTKKTGTLHLRRGAEHGSVHLRDGEVTGARADVARQELGRRLLGAGLVDDEVLASAAEELASDPTLSLAKLLASKGELAPDKVRELAGEQAHDAVFSLLRWPEGEFAFVVDEPDPDDLGASLAVEAVVTEGRRRLDAWPALVEKVPASDAVVSVNPAPESEPAADRDEWALLSLVDGTRTVADLVALSGRGDYAVVSALAGLVGRGLLIVGSAADGKLARRQSLLAALEGHPVAVEPETPTAPAVLNGPSSTSAPATSGPAASAPVIPARPEPFTPARRPDHAEEPVREYAQAGPSMSVGASAGSGARPSLAGGSHGSVNGATALQPEAQSSPYIERDPSVNKSLLLRLIAGVRGL